MFQFHHLPLYLEWAPTNIFAKNLEKSSADQGGEVDTKEETLEEKKADVGKSKPVREWCFKNSFFFFTVQLQIQLNSSTSATVLLCYCSEKFWMILVHLFMSVVCYFLMFQVDSGVDSGEEEEEEAEPGANLFVKNLNFNTEESSVKEVK